MGGKVVVVGAGLSGLALARELLDRGFDVEVVEHRDRVGGVSIIDPEAMRIIDKVARDIKVRLRTTALMKGGSVVASSRDRLEVIDDGFAATGYRVSTLVELGIFGCRPAGIYPFHAALDLVLNDLSPGMHVAFYGLNRYSLLLSRMLLYRSRRIVIIDPKTDRLGDIDGVEVIRARIRSVHGAHRLSRVETSRGTLRVDTLIISMFRPWNPLAKLQPVGHAAIETYDPADLVEMARLYAENLSCNGDRVELYIDRGLGNIRVFPRGLRSCVGRIMIYGGKGRRIRVNGRAIVLDRDIVFIDIPKHVDQLRIEQA